MFIGKDPQYRLQIKDANIIWLCAEILMLDYVRIK